MPFLLVFLASEEKAACMKSLLAEQRDLSLQAAGHSLSAIHLRQRLYIYQRYFTALARFKPPKIEHKKSIDSLPEERLQVQQPSSIDYEFTIILFLFYIYRKVEVLKVFRSKILKKQP